MDQPTPPLTDADLLSAVEVVEAQPLETRAPAYEALLEGLARRLESEPTRP